MATQGGPSIRKRLIFAPHESRRLAAHCEFGLQAEHTHAPETSGISRTTLEAAVAVRGRHTVLGGAFVRGDAPPEVATPPLLHSVGFKQVPPPPLQPKIKRNFT